MNKKMAREIVESLPSLYPSMTADEEEAIWTVLATNSNTENDGDCISRQAAIDGINKLMEIHFDRRVVLKKARNVVEQLPSAQPEQNLDEWCYSCKEYDKEKHSCPRWNKVIKNTVDELKSAQPEQCEDAVSRKAVKDGFVEMCSLICPYTEKQRHTMCGSCLLGTAFDVLEATQPVTPKQRIGHWIPVGMVEAVGGESAQWGSAIAHHKCSECDEQALRDDFEQEVLSDFCPHCGVMMR